MDRQEARTRAQELVEKMTVEEAASQLRYDAPAIDRLGIPAYNWWGEALHGVARAGCATSFPQAIGMAASFDEELIGEIADVIAEEGRAKYNAYSGQGDRDIYKGLTFWSPNVNIFRDPRWGRGQETYGEDPYLTGVLGEAFVKHLQSEEDGYMKAAACAKHFAVHSGPEALRHFFDAKATPKDMRETYLPAFERLVKAAGVEAVMGAYNRTNGEPCCASHELMENILRGEWGFEGHYVSDCWAVRDFHENHKVTGTPEESAALAINTGCDLNCGNTFIYLYEAYKQGLVTEETLRRAAVRLFTTRYLLGLFDETSYDEIPYTAVECPAHLEVSERAAAEGMVLLKNDGILPLKLARDEDENGPGARSAVRTIGVVGPNANSRKALVGNYHGTATEYITPLDGLLHYIGSNGRVLYSEGCDIQEDRIEKLAVENDRISEAMIVADESDVVIAVVGLNENMEGEEGDTGNSYASGDKTDLYLPESQQALLNALAETEKPVILCLEAGSAIDLGFAQEHFAAVIQMWYPGARGGKVLAELLFGDRSFSGKLPVTFYNGDDPIPDFEDYSMKGRTYRYIEHEPLYPFGYGLSYADLAVTNAQIMNQDLVSVVCENRSDIEAEDVVQIYVQCDSADATPNPRLCGFKRVRVPAGKTAACEVALDPYAFTVIDEEGRRVKAEKAVLFAGTGQPDRRTQVLTGKECIRMEVAVE